MPWTRVLAGGDDDGGDIFGTGVESYRETPLQVCFAFISIVGVTFLADSIIHHLSNIKNETTRAFLDAIFKEIMLLGIISLTLAILQDVDAFGTDLIHVFEFLHLSIFIVALFYIVSMIVLWLSVKHLSQAFSDYELYCVTFAFYASRHSGDSLSLPSPYTDPEQPDPELYHEPMFLVDRVLEKLEAYQEWLRTASCLERIRCFRLHLMASRWRHIVSYNRFRTVFISQCRRDPELAPLMNHGFQFARFLRKRLRNEAIRTARIGRVPWIVLAVLVGFDTLRIYLMRDRADDNDDDGTIRRYLAGSDDDRAYKPIDLTDDLVYWVAVVYAVFLMAFVLYYELRYVLKAFKHQQAANHEVDTILDGIQNIDAKKKEDVRKAISGTIFLHEFYPKFERMRPLVLPVLKCIYLIYAWVFMLFAIVLARFLIEAGPGVFIGVFFLLFVPMVVAYWLIIPSILMTMGILLAIGNIDSDRESMKNLIQRTNRGVDKSLSVAMSKRSKELNPNLIGSLSSTRTDSPSSFKRKQLARRKSVHNLLQKIFDERDGEEDPETTKRTLKEIRKRVTRSLSIASFHGVSSDSRKDQSSDDRTLSATPASRASVLDLTDSSQSSPEDEKKNDDTSRIERLLGADTGEDGDDEGDSPRRPKRRQRSKRLSEFINLHQIYGDKEDDERTSTGRWSMWTAWRDGATNAVGSVQLIQVPSHRNYKRQDSDTDEDDEDERNGRPRGISRDGSQRSHADSILNRESTTRQSRESTHKQHKRRIREIHRNSVMQSDATDDFLETMPEGYKDVYMHREGQHRGRRGNSITDPAEVQAMMDLISPRTLRGEDPSGPQIVADQHLVI